MLFHSVSSFSVIPWNAFCNFHRSCLFRHSIINIQSVVCTKIKSSHSIYSVMFSECSVPPIRYQPVTCTEDSTHSMPYQSVTCTEDSTHSTPYQSVTCTEDSIHSMPYQSVTCTEDSSSASLSLYSTRKVTVYLSSLSSSFSKDAST